MYEEAVALALSVLAIAGASVTGTGSPAGDELSKAKAIVSAKCTACHAVDIVHEKRATRAEWEQIVARMRDYGADVGESDRDVIIRYLATTHGT